MSHWILRRLRRSAERGPVTFFQASSSFGTPCADSQASLKTPNDKVLGEDLTWFEKTSLA
eukprot:6132851-Pyramimonas_sp.AAC.1